MKRRRSANQAAGDKTKQEKDAAAMKAGRAVGVARLTAEFELVRGSDSEDPTQLHKVA